MKINYTGRNIETTDGLKEYTEKRVNRHLSHFDTIHSIDVNFNVVNLTQTASAKLHVDGGHVVATADSDDMYKAIDLLVDKLDKLMIKHKEK